MHFLSDHEYAAFLELWWDESVDDIREQYPLNLRRTLTIAGQMEVSHPVDSHTGILLTQTTDILATRGTGDDRSFTAWAVKDSEELTDERAMDKLEIERRYWEELGVSWELVVNDGLNSFRAENLVWLLEFENAMRKNTRVQADCVSRVLAAVREGRSEVAGTACQRLDIKWGTEPGAHVAALRFLFLFRLLRGNLEVNSLSRQSLTSFEVAS
ncbi:TnsA endonuclease N-terminal domain-containing protein [Burkholderia ubonensis]|uniref:TnsA endonuclease N-terminal domain-containing protein n=1 Tax=Burkholderia ubonensis TaxID=101571 RepID=UPI00162A4708|nr:TnsA endonuclease N-terminal domain-containing protein [Burkholderia ubonensis]